MMPRRTTGRKKICFKNTLKITADKKWTRASEWGCSQVYAGDPHMPMSKTKVGNALTLLLGQQQAHVKGPAAAIANGSPLW